MNQRQDKRDGIRRGLDNPANVTRLFHLLAVLCAVSEYGITPAINEVQARSFGASQEPEAAARFSELHQWSRTVFGIVGLGVLILIVLQARPSRDPSHPDT